MCGLAGVASSHITDVHRRIFAELMIGAQLRGFHACGVASVFKGYGRDETPNFMWDKCVGGPIDLFQRKTYDLTVSRQGARALIGHCRHGTVGQNTRQNAHPFETTNMVGVHNGTIRGKQKDSEFYGTDSECLLNRIDDEGLQPAMAETEGAWALNWFDLKDGTLNFLRNDQRTLYMARSTQDNTLYWTSEYGLLWWVMNRNNVRNVELFLMKQDTHFSFKLFETDWLSIDAGAQHTPVKGKEESRWVASNAHFPQGTQQTRTEATPAESGDKSQSGETERKSSLTTGSFDQKKQSETGEDLEWVRKSITSISKPSAAGTENPQSLLTHTGFGGKKYSKGMFRHILNMGCINCAHIPKSSESVRFFADNVFLCHECMEDQEVIKDVQYRVKFFSDGNFDGAAYDQLEYMQ